MLLQLLVTFTLCTTLPLAHSHYNWSPSSSSAAVASPPIGGGRHGATYYAAVDPRDVVGGACGYGDLERSGYGKSTAGLSTVLFEKGQICGAVLKSGVLRNSGWCIPGTSVIVTATNFCAPNYGFEPDGGGHCNPPNAHFVLPIEAFEKIAIWKASNMPVQYRSNVAGASIVAAKVKGSRTGWLPMGRIWGQNWHISADLKNQPLSFEITSSAGVTLTSYNVAPKNWNFGQTYQGKQFES
ncbi:Expansin-A13 [Datura stramonium]|uniref:Expansin n=1 Tax=Datura stramonium TaxID=4076 RepID=A0ABS8RW92_DATST|nr:Expansin-A13 [Datura stramonium]